MKNPNQGVYVTLDELIRLRSQGQSFVFLPKQPIHSLLSGQKSSKLRGRGLNFEEIRNYLPGDDTRNIDWKVTARLRGKPHIRVYTEERDRPALLIVDQRINMFFGSVKYMKSVSAAKTAAIAAWRILGVKDRVGAVVFNDQKIEVIRPGGSVKRVMQILKTLVTFNNSLKLHTGISAKSSQLNEALKSALRATNHDYLIVVISDMDGADDITRKLMSQLSKHNDVLIGFVHDPMEEHLPELNGLVVTDGELQLQIKGRNTSLLDGFTAKFRDRYALIKKVLLQRNIPIIPITTSSEPIDQIQEALTVSQRKVL